MTNRIDELLKKLANENAGKLNIQNTYGNAGNIKLKKEDYPLSVKRPDLVKTPLGKKHEELSLSKAMDGKVEADDLKISDEVLEYQAQIAESAGKKQLAENFRRAAELTRIPDQRILEMYDLLRPRRATKKQLLEMADEIRNKYKAVRNAELIEEAIEVYQKRGILLKEG